MAIVRLELWLFAREIDWMEVARIRNYVLSALLAARQLPPATTFRTTTELRS